MTNKELWESLPDPIKRNIKDLQVLFPYINFAERINYIDRLRDVPELAGVSLAQITYMIYNPIVTD